ncbi:unnamed protein product [Gongylonema pulchrum]|uniref:EGF-like domain-containing protein n=1 Tax=Gongylonema pulchrum TaxID=637853 RepID=A0A183EY62_9BILA|nr:unnamed protein product [Gongylonema pulchrum]
MSDSIEYLKKIFGITTECLNGGVQILKGQCKCPTFYRGNTCEDIVCANNGTLVKIPNLEPAQYVCKCPHPEYITGKHCEFVKCMNGGQLMESGYCRCSNYLYSGQFCQINNQVLNIFN